MIYEKKLLLQKYSRVLSISKLFSLEISIVISCFTVLIGLTLLCPGLSQTLQGSEQFMGIIFIDFVKSIYVFVFFYNICSFTLWSICTISVDVL